MVERSTIRGHFNRTPTSRRHNSTPSPLLLHTLQPKLLFMRQIYQSKLHALQEDVGQDRPDELCILLGQKRKPVNQLAHAALLVLDAVLVALSEEAREIPEQLLQLGAVEHPRFVVGPVPVEPGGEVEGHSAGLEERVWGVPVEIAFSGEGDDVPNG